MICCICNSVILTGEQYRYDEHGNTTHVYHKDPDCCPVCDRLIGKFSSNGKITYPDGRYICGFCANENPVNNMEILKQAFFYAKNLLQEKGFEFPKVVVCLASKNDFIRLGYHNGLGLTSSWVTIGQGKHKIRVLYGLPMLLTTGVLAHELLHVWQNSRGLSPEPVISEGLCELGSGLIYQRSKNNVLLGKLLFQKLETNRLSTYSEGFKFMKNMLENYGWQAVREYVKQNSKYSFN
jgi:hypothetical protein